MLVAGPWATRIWEHPGVLRLVVSELLTLAVGFGAYMMMVGVGFGEGMAALRIVFPPASVAALLASHTLASFVGTDGRKKAHWLQPSEVEAAGQRALASWRPIAIIARRTPRGRTARTQYAVLATVLGVVGFAAIGQAVTSDSADVPAGYMVSVVAFASAIGVGALAVFPFLPGWWAAPITVVSIPAAAVLTPAVLAPLALLELVAAAWQPPWRDDEPPRGGDR